MLDKFKSPEFRTNLLMCIFIASVITSNILGGKISEISLLGLPVVFSVGLIPFFMTFFILDSINEVHGKQKARELIWLAMLTLVFVALVTIVASALPFAQRSWVTAAQFDPVFSQSLRIILASITAFFFADMVDASVFHALKQKMQGNFLWLRSNVSNIIGQVIDTFFFMFIAFYDPAKGYDVNFVVGITLPYLFLKIMLSFVNTPFVYGGVRWLRGAVHK